MKTLLKIQSSLFNGQGQSSALARRVADHWLEHHPDGRVITRDLGQDPVPHLDLERFQALTTAPEVRSDAQREVVAYSDGLIAELKSADVIVLAVPMYNFTVPSALHAYFDHVARAGETFRYTEKGPEGLVTGKKAYVVVTRGGVYGEDHSQTRFIQQFLGFIGITSQIKKLFGWADSFDMGYIAFIVVFATIVMYAYLEHIRMRWLAIPLGSALASVIAFALGAPFEFTTEPGVPNLNPMYWWGETTGWQIGLPELHHFIAVAPFAVLAVAMWSPDFLGHRVFQQLNYPPKAKKVLMNIDDTMCVAAARQIVGTSLGGGNLASSWGTFMVPAAIAKRPIPAGALLTGLLCVVAALWGYPMDLAIWPPVLSVALMVGVFLPLLEAGMQMTREGKTSQSAAIVIFSSALVNPVFGWSLTVLLDNLGLIGDKERGQSLSHLHRWVIPTIVFIVLCAVMLGIGMFPGIPAMLESFRIDL